MASYNPIAWVVKFNLKELSSILKKQFFGDTLLFNAKQEDLLKFLVYWSGTLSGGLIPNPVSRLIELASEDLTANQRHSVPLSLLIFLNNDCLHASPMIRNSQVHRDGELPDPIPPCPLPSQRVCALCKAA